LLPLKELQFEQIDEDASEYSRVTDFIKLPSFLRVVEDNVPQLKTVDLPRFYRENLRTERLPDGVLIIGICVELYAKG
jgi:hypothetical protein